MGLWGRIAGTWPGTPRPQCLLTTPGRPVPRQRLSEEPPAGVGTTAASYNPPPRLHGDVSI